MPYEITRRKLDGSITVETADDYSQVHKLFSTDAEDHRSAGVTAFRVTRDGKFALAWTDVGCEPIEPSDHEGFIPVEDLRPGELEELLEGSGLALKNAVVH